MKNLLKSIDAFLLPRDLCEQFSPYVWLIYLPLFFGPVLYYSNDPIHWLWTAIATVCFLVAYFRVYWVDRKHVIFHILAIVVIGTLSALYTPSAQTFFIYAASFCSRLKPVKVSFITLAGIVVWMALISWLFKLEAYFYLPGILFSLIVGLLNIYQFALNEKKQELILSQKEAERLAKVAERERIARDLHDLIGHTFSVITLKADLANRLLDKGMTKSLDKDLERARTEIKQLEDISRDALSQVREVVSGYRSSDLLSELANAKHVFASLDVDFSYEFVGVEEQELELDLASNKELAIVLRELVTNIIKHAKATQVSVTVSRQGNSIRLNVKDDGVGISDATSSGFGLKGIEERVQKIKGQVSIISGGQNLGTSTIISVPDSVLE
ncbi:sensor histidine kinase [Paraglaciecola sp.]|uniref:sensor histidine kinase n=1 Tax=Paraglaciecola sp. TaxID=1920173 RepID=UPI003EF79089